MPGNGSAGATPHKRDDAGVARAARAGFTGPVAAQGEPVIRIASILAAGLTAALALTPAAAQEPTAETPTAEAPAPDLPAPDLPDADRPETEEPQTEEPETEEPKEPEAKAPTSAPVLRLTEEMLDWAPNIGRYLAPGPDRAAVEGFPILADNAKIDGAEVLRRLIAQGAAAGLAGVIYENRDRGHSRLDARLFPQVTPVRYAGTLYENRADYGMAGPVLFRAPVIGNSSTAVVLGKAPRSLTRLAMTTPGAPERAFQGYAANHLYVYPEHRDHDRVDLYPANWPYTVQSQGSSYTDRPFYEALLLTLAAFTPETRARAEAEGLIAPTLQMILRRTQAGVQTRAAYLSGLAHPMAFERDALRPGLMASLAASLAPGDLPPLVALRVEVENFRPRAGLADLSERLFDTPSAIARVWRGWEGEKEMIVSAAQTRDPNGRALAFDWVLLRGDPDLVQITPLDAAGTRARITVQWHDRRPVLPRAERLTDRVDIGVFANNGVHDSAPAFVSISFPTHERREFETGPDGRPRLISVDYDAAARNRSYDPVLHWSAPWRDVLAHDDRGRVVGWTRHFADGTTEAFDRPVTGAAHRISRPKDALPVLRVRTEDG